MRKEKKQLIKVNTTAIKALILANDTTLDKVAKDIGIDVSTLSLKINNKRRIYLDEVANICIRLGINTPAKLKSYFGLDFLIISTSREKETLISGGGA